MTTTHKFHLYRISADLRKGFNGFCGLIQNDLSTSPTDSSVYIFINKTCDKVKLLHWSSSSFIMKYKRLESGTFEILYYDQQEESISLS